MFKWIRKQFAAFETVTAPQAAGHVIDPLPGDAASKDSCAALKVQGDACFNQGQFTEAAAYYRQAIALNPDYAEALNNLSNACRELGLREEAERCLKRAAEIKPLPNVHYNLATLLLEQGRTEASIAQFAEEVAHNPRHYAALAMQLHQMQKICAWEGLDSGTLALRNSLLEPHAFPEAVFSPFAFMALPGTTAAEQKICAEKWVAAEYQSLTALKEQLAFNHQRPRNQKIAVGYLSGDFREHPLARLTAEMFELHDRERFNITAYSYGPDDGSTMRKRLLSAFDKFVDLRAESDVDAARRIYADHVDILVDLTGFTENTRSGILALRPAPLQLSHLGYLGTMGAGFVDYLIADKFLVPPEWRGDYTERILYLPDCFQPNDRTRQRSPPPTRDACGLPNGAFVFCCFNQSYKIAPNMFDVWCRLLTAVPRSVLWLYASTPLAAENLRREALHRGVDTDRLVMASSVNVESYLARMQCADLFLDTSPYNAGTTCSDALWMGLPVVTCAGRTFSSRMAGSLLTALGMSELVAHTLDGYFHIARDLATDRIRLESIRGKIMRNRGSAPLFDSKRFTRNLEDAYIKMRL